MICFKTPGAFSLSGNIVNVNIGGTYLVEAAILLAPLSSGALSIQKNGSPAQFATYANQNISVDMSSQLVVFSIMVLSSGDGVNLENRINTLTSTLQGGVDGLEPTNVTLRLTKIS
ncbi:hypothetical protein QJS64_07955 [Paraclostridium bifermentans]|uniref:BclA C-terminal domain-containing protein n=1 Tax=Paraclostridium bifermentans TaxID=1490 RepID=A0ABY8R5X8_PARBF|nr:hypothetical protein QJS64_07955 [Paraclostridium bifermentans]